MNLHKARIFILFSILLAACSDGSTETSSLSNENPKVDSITIGRDIKKVQGRFIQIEKISERSYVLTLQINNDSIAVFQTLMPLNEMEIGLLKKTGNNIVLTYTEYENPVTKKVVKSVTSMLPIYETQNR
jgi:hypothetical protein